MWTHVKMATVTFRAKHVAQSDVRAWLHLGRGTTLLLTFISVFVEPDACLPKMARLTALGCTGVSTCSNIWVLCDLLLIFSANCNDQRGPVDLLWISSKDLTGAKTATEHTHTHTYSKDGSATARHGHLGTARSARHGVNVRHGTVWHGPTTFGTERHGTEI